MTDYVDDDRRSGNAGADRPTVPELAHAVGTRGRVLLVEDDPLVRAMLAEMLRRAGFYVRTADDGQGAIQQLGSARFDIVLTDVVMPHRDGLELLRWISGQDPAPAVIAMSGNGPDDGVLYTKAASSLGAARCLAKPVRRDALLAALDSLLAAAGTAQGAVQPK